MTVKRARVYQNLWLWSLISTIIIAKGQLQRGYTFTVSISEKMSNLRNQYFFKHRNTLNQQEHFAEFRSVYNTPYIYRPPAKVNHNDRIMCFYSITNNMQNVYCYDRVIQFLIEALLPVLYRWMESSTPLTESKPCLLAAVILSKASSHTLIRPTSARSSSLHSSGSAYTGVLFKYLFELVTALTYAQCSWN